MIKNLLLYFTRFLDRQVVLDTFRNGSSADSDYATLQTQIMSMPEHGRITDIRHLAFGDSIDKVRRAINGFSNTFLFIDYGTITSTQDRKDSWTDNLQMAVTVADKISDQADLIEEQLLSNRTLLLLNAMRAWMVVDSQEFGWLRLMSDRHQLDPFVSPELKSIGWTLTFSIDAQDLLNVKELILQYRMQQ